MPAVARGGDRARCSRRCIVCLGSTAAQSLLGPPFRITKSRGEVIESPWAPVLIATYHPSAVLRSDTPAHGEEVYRALVSDLALAGQEARKSSTRRTK